MRSYALHRIGAAAITLAGASVIIFFFIHLIPGDPLYVLLGDSATPDQVAALRTKMGLDQPIVLQYLHWLGNVAHGDFGTSIFFQSPVAEVILDGAETSILLALLTMVWITLIGIPVGVIAAMRNGSWLDQSLSGAAMLLASVPTFWVGLYFILIFAAWLGWLPSSGYPSIFEEGNLGNLRYLLLPSLTLAAPNAALILRLTRASMLDIAREDFVRTARAKGIRPIRVTFRHILAQRAAGRRLGVRLHLRRADFGGGGHRNGLRAARIGAAHRAIDPAARLSGASGNRPGHRGALSGHQSLDRSVLSSSRSAGGTGMKEAFRTFMDPFLGRPIALFGLAVLVTIAFVAAFAPYLAPYDPSVIEPVERLLPPSLGHLFRNRPVRPRYLLAGRLRHPARPFDRRRRGRLRTGHGRPGRGCSRRSRPATRDAS